MPLLNKFIYFFVVLFTALIIHLSIKLTKMSFINIDLSKTVEYLLDWYKVKNAREEIFSNLKERLYWELSWNLEILDELDHVGKKEEENILEVNKSLIGKFNFNQFDIISSTGIPMNSIVQGNFDPNNLTNYRSYLSNITKNSQLVQKTYHRLRIHQLRYEHNILRSRKSTDYLIFLCLEAKNVLI